MPNTSHGLPYPSGSGLVTDGDADFKDLADAVNPYVGDTGWITVGSGGGAPAYELNMSDANPGANYKTRFRRVGKIVTVVICCNKQATSTLIFTLPVGYRPAIPLFATVTGSGTGQVAINPTGAVGWGASGLTNGAMYGVAAYPTDEA